MSYVKHANRYWVIEEFKGSLVGKLHFTEFYDNNIILEWQLNDNEPDTFYYVSTLLNVEQDAIIADNPDDAMELFEDMIVERIEEEIEYLKGKLAKFVEEDYETFRDCETR